MAKHIRGPITSGASSMASITIQRVTKEPHPELPYDAPEQEAFMTLAAGLLAVPKSEIDAERAKTEREKPNR
jgi:hypothetical protein